MIALTSPSYLLNSVLKRIESKPRRQLVPLRPGDTDPSLSKLTNVLLTDLSEIALVRLGVDPLSRYETQVALLSDSPYTCEADIAENTIFISETFIEAIEFAAAQAALVNICGKLEKALSNSTDDPHGLGNSIREAKTALHSLYMSRMLLHILGECPAPRLAALLPEKQKPFVHHQVATCLTFALLHEQAHLEFAVGRARPEDMVDGKDLFVEFPLNSSQREEHSADVWAVRQVTESVRASFLRTATFFFFNQWVIDYLLHAIDSEHPPGFNRIQHLMKSIPDMQKSDSQFFDLMTKGLNQQHKIRLALNKKSKEDRYSSLLRYCRASCQFENYEPLVNSVCRAFEELGLSAPTS